MPKRDEMKDVHEGSGWSRYTLKQRMADQDKDDQEKIDNPNPGRLSKQDPKTEDPDSVWHTHFSYRTK